MHSGLLKALAVTETRRLTGILACMLFTALPNTMSYAENIDKIVVYYSENNDFQKQLASALYEKISIYNRTDRVKYLSNNDTSQIGPDDLIISIGTQQTIDKQLRILHNNIIYIDDSNNRVEKTSGNTSYINIEITQPACRHLYLIRTINSQWKHIGYMTSESDDSRLVELRACAKKLGIKVSDELISNDEDLPGALDKLVISNDVILALPDSRVYNRHSVKNILLSAYRQRIPVIGFSDNFVNAGALAAVYSSSEQIAQQVADSILEIDNAFQPIVRTSVYPKDFTVSINKQVANALDLNISSEETLHKSLKDMETGL